MQFFKIPTTLSVWLVGRFRNYNHRLQLDELDVESGASVDGDKLRPTLTRKARRVGRCNSAQWVHSARRLLPRLCLSLPRTQVVGRLPISMLRQSIRWDWRVHRRGEPERLRSPRSPRATLAWELRTRQPLFPEPQN